MSFYRFLGSVVLLLVASTAAAQANRILVYHSCDGEPCDLVASGIVLGIAEAAEIQLVRDGSNIDYTVSIIGRVVDSTIVESLSITSHEFAGQCESVYLGYQQMLEYSPPRCPQVPGEPPMPPPPPPPPPPYCPTDLADAIYHGVEVAIVDDAHLLGQRIVEVIKSVIVAQ